MAATMSASVRPFRVFISYSGQDEPFAEDLVHFLEAEGKLACFFAPRNIPAQVDWQDQLTAEVRQADVVVLVYTPQAVQSEYVRFEIDEAVRTFREAGGTQLALLKCTSAYPAPPEEMNLRTIPHLAHAFGTPVGLSDHTLGIAVPVAAVALGACLIEKHFTLSRSDPGPDSAFSIEPHEFKAMVEAVRTAEKALGGVTYELTEKEKASRTFRRSLFVVQNMHAGDLFTEENVRSIRPSHGLPPGCFEQVVHRKAACDIRRGTPLTWALIA